jgi:hypothetical protein
MAEWQQRRSMWACVSSLAMEAGRGGRWADSVELWVPLLYFPPMRLRVIKIHSYYLCRWSLVSQLKTDEEALLNIIVVIVICYIILLDIIDGCLVVAWWLCVRRRVCC